MKERILKLLFSALETPELTIKEQKTVIDSFPNPRNDYDRVFFNYKCTAIGQRLATTVVLDIVGGITCLVLLVVYSINRIFLTFTEKKEYCDAIIIEHTNRLGVRYSYEGRLPEQLFDEYKDIKTIRPGTFPKLRKGVLGITPVKIWIAFVIKHPLRGFVNLRVLVNLMGLQRVIVKHKPKAIVISRADLNGVSSLTTYSCEQQGIQYINLMHGEMMAEYRTAFVRFTKFYIWDEGYIDIFGWARCDNSQFVVFTPEIYEKKEKTNKESRYFLLYALTGNEKTGRDEAVEAIKTELQKIAASGKHCKVRPHPRWSDTEYVKEVFKDTGIEVENPREITATESILESKYVASTFSTVLSEAYYLGKPIIIDDLTNPSEIKMLEERKYLMLKKEHFLLSSVVNDVSNY